MKFNKLKFRYLLWQWEADNNKTPQQAAGLFKISMAQYYRIRKTGSVSLDNFFKVCTVAKFEISDCITYSKKPK